MTEDTCAAVRQSDQIAIIITPELPAIRNAVRSIEYLVGLHYPEKSIDVVLNRQSKNSMLTDQEIETALHRPIDVKIPNSYGEIAKAINSGTPVPASRNAKLSLAFDGWSDRLMGEAPADDAGNNKARSWFNLFG